MVCGRLTMPRVERFRRSGLAALLGIAGVLAGAGDVRADCPDPARAVYLTFDTGHMGVAPLIADTLARHGVRVTFFAAHERTQTGDGSLGDAWAAWWKARADEGHAFASHR